MGRLIPLALVLACTSSAELASSAKRTQPDFAHAVTLRVPSSLYGYDNTMTELGHATVTGAQCDTLVLTAHQLVRVDLGVGTQALDADMRQALEERSWLQVLGEDIRQLRRAMYNLDRGSELKLTVISLNSGRLSTGGELRVRPLALHAPLELVTSNATVPDVAVITLNRSVADTCPQLPEALPGARGQTSLRAHWTVIGKAADTSTYSALTYPDSARLLVDVPAPRLRLSLPVTAVPEGEARFALSGWSGAPILFSKRLLHGGDTALDTFWAGVQTRATPAGTTRLVEGEQLVPFAMDLAPHTQRISRLKSWVRAHIAEQRAPALPTGGSIQMRCSASIDQLLDKASLAPVTHTDFHELAKMKLHFEQAILANESAVEAADVEVQVRLSHKETFPWMMLRKRAIPAPMAVSPTLWLPTLGEVFELKSDEPDELLRMSVSMQQFTAPGTATTSGTLFSVLRLRLPAARRDTTLHGVWAFTAASQCQLRDAYLAPEEALPLAATHQARLANRSP